MLRHLCNTRHLSLPDVLLCVTDNALYMKHPPCMHDDTFEYVHRITIMKIDLHPIYIQPIT